MNTNAEKPTPKDLVHPDRDGFRERITPKEPTEENGVFMFKCSNTIGVFKKKCNNVHFRHAGYTEILLPFIRAGNQKRVNAESHHVKVCTKCRACYVWINEQMYDITDQIDIKAWEKVEKEIHSTTGPGGDC
jgi:hypothetical protein